MGEGVGAGILRAEGEAEYARGFCDSVGRSGAISG